MKGSGFGAFMDIIVGIVGATLIVRMVKKV